MAAAAPILAVTLRRDEWNALIASMRVCARELDDIADAYRDHWYWALADVLLQGAEAIRSALHRFDDPQTISRPAPFWTELLEAFTRGCHELGSSYDQKDQQPAAKRALAAFAEALAHAGR
jgi:hypothetical protein